MVRSETYFYFVINNKHSLEGWKEARVIKGFFLCSEEIFVTECLSFGVKGDSEKLTGSYNQICSWDTD